MLRRTLRRRRAGYRKSCKSIVNGPRHIERQSDRPPPLRTASRVSRLCGPPQLKMNFLKFNLVVRTDWGPTSLALVLHVYKKRLNAYNEDLTMLSPVGSRVSAQAIVVAIGLMICGACAAG